MVQTVATPAQGGKRSKLSGGLGIAISVVVLALAAFLIFRSAGGPSLDARERNYICAETLKPFAYKLREGESYPVTSPYTGERTGYPAEKCYWTADGRAKKEPTYVLLNKYIGKEEPTICPDCGRVVKPHNPAPPMELMREAIQGN